MLKVRGETDQLGSKLLSSWRGWGWALGHTPPTASVVGYGGCMYMYQYSLGVHTGLCGGGIARSYIVLHMYMYTVHVYHLLQYCVHVFSSLVPSSPS